MRPLKAMACLIVITLLAVAGCGGGGGGGSAATTPPDTTAPTVSVTAPANGATISGFTTVAITADASDNVGVTKVEFYVNNVLKATDTAAPYSYNWDTASVANGAYTLSAKAYDAAGNVGQSTTVTVTVNNLITASTSTAITAPTAIGTVSVAGVSPAIICGLDLRITYPNGVQFVSAVRSGVTPAGSSILPGNIGATETNVSVAGSSGFSSGEVLKVDFSNVMAGTPSASFGVSVASAFDCNGVQIQ